jgi:hypothetical protein
MKIGDLVKIKGNLSHWLHQSKGETGRITALDTKPNNSKRTWRRVIWPHVEEIHPHHDGFIYPEEDLEIIKLKPPEPDFTLDEIHEAQELIDGI